MKMKTRKIAANYIFLPGFPLTKNGYVVLEEGKAAAVVDTGEEIREIQGLEFYGGWIVASCALAFQSELKAGDSLVPWLRKLYDRCGEECGSIGIWEGVDLRNLVWREEARFSLLDGACRLRRCRKF